MNNLTRFYSKVRKSEGCWSWLAGKDKDGYGKFWYLNDTIRANRASWILHKGPIPEGMHILHSCDNPECTNPEHLFLGTSRDNVLDMVAKNRNVGNTKLEESDVICIRALYFWFKHRVVYIAEEFKVSPSTIQFIIQGKTWKHIRTNFGQTA